ncbi:CehA/McbA family metallohydrolase [Glaciecola siphonariae]|uniref:CehA/McbA family metallohydrolase n=1 Tax=Glaciecola siphonariae TaxID=521012 RepID=A0ABV9LVF4_9ALTE
MIDASALVADKPPITGEVAKTARDNAKALANGLAAPRSFIELRFDEDDVLAISAAGSHLFDNTNVALAYSPSFVQVGASSRINLKITSLYVNARCDITLNNTQSELSSCRLGDLVIPAFVVNALMKAGVWLLFDKEVSNTVDNMLAGLRYENRELVLFANKSADLRERVNQSLRQASGVAKVALSNDLPPPELIDIYLERLYSTDYRGQSLLLPMTELAQLASVRSLDNSPQEENAALIWALAIRYGSARFARLANVDDPETSLGVQIRGREDLALHFLYSAILEQVGNESLSFNIGELKEVLDSGSGGSGFSFVDLAADKAGIAFSKRLTTSYDDAVKAQSLLANAKSEIVFFPFTHDLPEGFSEASFARVFGEMNSPTYQNMESTIDTRISSLPIHNPIHNNRPLFTPPALSKVSAIDQGKWLKVDTHIHTTYSDGANSVDEIAEQASSFGCDVIAITDHGDKNLSGVLSDQYFADIQRANARFPYMTVMAGFEWNIPPFNGREHATVLFDQRPSDLRALAEFRRDFDHYKQRSTRHLNIAPAMAALNEYSAQAAQKPVLIYNHPSRKDASIDENFYDLSQWLSMSDLFIGMSGAPGHQAKRAQDNGSYNETLRTEHGWDPATSKIGGVWDQLLQAGYRVFGARAASDFHNTNMDYWPCQFSSTHVYSNSISPSDVLAALRAGKAWAQHGNFVKSVSFSISSNIKGIERKFVPGEHMSIKQDQALTLSIEIELNKADWQGFATSLDDLNLIIVQSSAISSVSLLPNATRDNHTYSLQLPFNVAKDLKAVRLQGRSIQAGEHHYQFMTNPIFFTEK